MACTADQTADFPNVSVEELSDPAVRRRVQYSSAPIIRVPEGDQLRREMADQWAVELGAVVQQEDE